MTRLTYAILTVVFLSFSLVGAVILVKQPQDWRNQATSCTSNSDCPADKPNCDAGQCKGGSCRDINDCASWEVCQGGGCRSQSGCTRDSDCADNKKCNNGTCEGGTPPTCDQCSPVSDDNKRCWGTVRQHCGNDYCWHHDPAKDNNQDCLNNPTATPRPTGGSTGSSPQCTSSPDSGCATGGRGGVDCADCRRTNGQVKQCTDGVWYCCYGDGKCYKGNTGGVVCSGTSITNNTSTTVYVETYRGCETNDKIGNSIPLGPGQSTSASKCTQIDVVNYCGVGNCDSSCQNTPITTPPPSNPTTPIIPPTNTPTLPAKATATAGPTPTTPVPTATNTPTPPTNTPTPTNTPIPSQCGSTPCGSSQPCTSGLICVTAIGGRNYCSKPEYQTACIESPNYTTCCQLPVSTNTPVPNATNTPTPTATPTSTIDDRQSNSPVPTRIALPEAGIDLPSRFLIIFGSIVTLIGFLVLI